MGTMTAPHTITRIMTRPIMTEATAVGIVVVLMAAEGATDQGSGVGSASLDSFRGSVARRWGAGNPESTVRSNTTTETYPEVEL